MSDLLALLGLGRRAGALAVGVEAVRRELQAGKLACVVVARDLSPRAQEKVARLATARSVPLITGPEAEIIGLRLGKPPVMAVGVRDSALASGMLQPARGRR